MFIAAGIFFASVETQKQCKRIFFRYKAYKQTSKINKNIDVKDCVFSQYYSNKAVATGGKRQERQEKVQQDVSNRKC